MSKIFKVTVLGTGSDRWVTIVEFSDEAARAERVGSFMSRSTPDSILEEAANRIAKKAILRRWRKLSPDNLGEPNFVQSYEVESLLDNDLKNVVQTGIGPFEPDPGIRVWIIDGPFSFGLGAPPHMGVGGAW